MQSDGVTFNPIETDGKVARPWVLDSIPLVITNREWQAISNGLAQRARLYELILQDLFGDMHLLRDGLLPPEALFGHPNYYPAYRTLPQSAPFLYLFAADLARAADGQFWVTGDRTRAPFGLGYLLENRLVTSRHLPQAFRQCQVKRLAPFFKAFQQSLRDLAPRYRDNPRIALWSKGPTSRSYFEDAYLARYLGYTLVEGDDLAVRDNQVMLKTLSGLLPIEVLLRRLDDDDCDPVELNPHSMIGTSGLLEVVRSKSVSLANALGSRIVESPIFLPFLAEICRRRLGEELAVPNIATWWCGDPSQLAYVLSRLDELLIRPSFRTPDNVAFQPQLMQSDERQNLIDRIKAEPWKFLGQERIERSTTPVWESGELRPWSLAFRGFVTLCGKEQMVLPSALARVSRDPTSLETAMTQGEKSQDVWVLSESKVEEVTLLPPRTAAMTLRRSGDDLPSRVADNFFWLGRNLERAEGQARLLRSVLLRMTDERVDVPELPALVRAMAEFGQLEPDYVIEGLRERMPDLMKVLPTCVLDDRPMGLRSTIAHAYRIAFKVRDRMAVDMWHIIQDMDLVFSARRLNSPGNDPAEGLAILELLIVRLVALSGLVAESMTRTHAWRFIDMGRRIERASQAISLGTATLCDSNINETATLEAALMTLDSYMTYRSRYLASIQPVQVIDLLVIDETNPRSIAYQIAVLIDHVDKLPRDEREVTRSAEQRLVLGLQHHVMLTDANELMKSNSHGQRDRLRKLFDRLQDSLLKLSNAISGRFLIHAGVQRHLAGQEETR
jgi:uncharacterized circularly permuted ATP-grasp superfamily protein/uncharacterized alpha-E superfamily protein